jgi:phosphoribosyl-dephospho-CoA transferase
MEEVLSSCASPRLIEVSPHDLLRIKSVDDLSQLPPAWVYTSLKRSCWVVVRRSFPREGMVPVGVRGTSRDQRFAAYLSREAILERVTPEELVRRLAWMKNGRREEISPIRALDLVGRIMLEFGLQWGPSGSVGFEIATGLPIATMNSDLDLVIRAPNKLSHDLCRRLCNRLADELPVRTDVLIETGAGAIALAEYVRGDLPILFRSATGPKLVYRPWHIAG